MNPWVMPRAGARGQNLGHPNKVVYYKQLNKEGWASDMWHYFHAPVILPNILKTISWVNVILRILVLCDTTIDILTNVGHLDLYFMVQWFCLISWMLFDVWTSLFGVMNQYDQTVDRKINVGHCDLYFMVQWFHVTSWKQFDVWLS